MHRSIFVALCSVLVACSGDDDAAGNSTSSSSSGSSSSGGSSSGGSSSGGSSGASSSGGSSSGTPSDAGTDASSVAGLGTGDGITGTIDGTPKTFTFNAQRVPQQTTTAVIGATSTQYAPNDKWTLRLNPTVGAQTCTGATGTEDVFIQFGSQTDYNANGTTAGTGAKCSINVISLSPKFEGSFTATLVTTGGVRNVTDGYFRVNN